MKLKRPTPSMAVSIAALVVALGGTSYAATQIQTSDIAKDAVVSNKILDGTIKAKDLSAGAKTSGPRGPQGAPGANGNDGADGADGADGLDGISRWALVEANGTISAQSGGFSVITAYPVLGPGPNGTDPNGLRANGNVYINAGESLVGNGVLATIALQNTVDQNGDAITNGRAGADLNFEFAGEISTSLCNVGAATTPPSGPTNCAPQGAQNANSFVVSPRNSDGTPTADNQRKRFYVVITGDSSDYVPAPAPRG